MADAFQVITREEGPRALWRGSLFSYMKARRHAVSLPSSPAVCDTSVLCGTCLAIPDVLRIVGECPGDFVQIFT